MHRTESSEIAWQQDEWQMGHAQTMFPRGFASLQSMRDSQSRFG
jgi:hypothetical protein